MPRLLSMAAILLALSVLPGCNNLSPRDNLSPQLEQRLDDIEGSQNTLENNQNAIKIEIGRLQNSLDVGGDGNQVQQGWLNVQADGILIAIFSFSTISLLVYYMLRSTKYEKIAGIMGDSIRYSDNADLKENVIASAWNTNVEETIYKMIE